MEECSLCGRERVNLVNAIISGEVRRICDFCAADPDIIVINKPTESQLKEAERCSTVYERLRRMANLKVHKDEFEHKQSLKRQEAQINLTKLAAVKNDENFMKKQAERKQLNLSQDFTDQIQKARNLKGMSQKQLADGIAESEETVRMIERGIMPQESEKTIKKVEQYLRIDLRKKPEAAEKDIDFRSPVITVGEMKKMREEMFGKKKEEKQSGGNS